MHAKPSKKSISLSKDAGPNYLHYKIIENKYESITFQNLTLKRYNIIEKNNEKHEIKSSLFKYENGIPSYAGIPIYSTVQGMNIKILQSITYPGGLKYYNMAFSKYWQNLKNKKIVIIKQIGPREIIEGQLQLYFNEEHFLRQNNTVKTIFCYSGWNVASEWSSISQTDFDYEVITDITKINKTLLKADLYIIDKISIHSKFSCIDDLSVIPTHMILIYQCLINMNTGASLVLLQAMPWSQAHVQLFYYIYASFFKELSYHKSKLSSIKNGQFIFSNYTKNPVSIANFKKLVKKYISVDKDLGYSLYIPIRTTWCNMQWKMPEGKITDILISSIFFTNGIISEQFTSFMNAIYKKRKKAEKEYIERITYLQTTFIDVNAPRALQKIQKFIYNNIEDSLAYIKKKGLQINELYLQNTVPNPAQLIKSMFPGQNSSITSAIILSRDSVYSVSNYSVAEKTSMLIKKHFPGVHNVIDGCANIGGNTFNFSKHFRFVVANEIQDSTYSNLVNNINTLQLKNIYTINSDITSLLKDTAFLSRINYSPDTYVLYLDPPWSGVWYQLETVVDLCFNNINILSFIKSAPVRYICIKVPKNYNMQHLFDAFDNIVVYKVEYCYIIIINIIINITKK